MLLFTLGHPGVQRPQVGDRNVGKRQVMQVAIGAKFRRKRGVLVAAPALRLPDLFPEALLKPQGRPIFRRGGVRHLRPLVVPGAGLNMVDPFDKGAEVIAGVIQQAFAYHDPVADIGGKAQLRQLLNYLQRQPRAIQRRGAMGFKAAEQLIFGGELMRFAEKIHLLRQRPAVVTGQQIDEARIKRFCRRKTFF